MGQVIVGILVALALVGVLVSLRRREEIAPGYKGLLYRDGVFERELEAGTHRLFDPARKLRVARIDLLPRVTSAQVFDIISKDKFSFRVTLAALVQVTDARAFHEATRRPSHPDARMVAMMAAHENAFPLLSAILADAVLQVGAQVDLEPFLADPAAALAQVGPKLGSALPGARLDGLLVTAIQLPPEVRKMFTEIERARREGLAALERARGEQASLRALANAARNLAGNPDLVRLRLLQVMESARGSKTFVLGDATLGDAGAAKG